MKKHLRQLTAFLSSLGLVLLISAFASDQPANFSGTWLLNLEKSEIGNAPIPKSGKSAIKVLSQEPAIIMEKSITDSLGKIHSGIDTVTFNKTVTLDAGNGQMINRTMKQEWSADKQVMKLLSKFTADNNGEPVEFDSTETWSLSDSGNTLTIMNETIFPDRTEKLKLVYTKN